MSKHRKYTVTIHNVNKDDTIYWHNAITDASRYVTSIEEYPEPEKVGHYHLHAFIEYTNARYFKATLKLFENLKRGHIVPAPDAEKTPGRVQLDAMKGSFDQAIAYLTEGQSSKDKKFGQVQDSAPALCAMCHTRPHTHRGQDMSVCIPCMFSIRDFQESSAKVGRMPSVSEVIELFSQYTVPKFHGQYSFDDLFPPPIWPPPNMGS
jgi:cytochrome c553